jgi:hypothetical protein
MDIISNDEILKISIFQQGNDGVTTKIIKTIKGMGTPWPEVLAEFIDMVRSLGYDIPLTYDDIMNLQSSNSFENKSF